MYLKTNRDEPTIRMNSPTINQLLTEYHNYTPHDLIINFIEVIKFTSFITCTTHIR